MVENLDFRVKPYDPKQTKEMENSNETAIQEWNDEKRLELVRGLIAFLGGD